MKRGAELSTDPRLMVRSDGREGYQKKNLKTQTCTKVEHPEEASSLRSSIPQISGGEGIHWGGGVHKENLANCLTNQEEKGGIV